MTEIFVSFFQSLKKMLICFLEIEFLKIIFRILLKY